MGAGKGRTRRAQLFLRKTKGDIAEEDLQTLTRNNPYGEAIEKLLSLAIEKGIRIKVTDLSSEEAYGTVLGKNMCLNNDMLPEQSLFIIVHELTHVLSQKTFLQSFKKALGDLKDNDNMHGETRAHYEAQNIASPGEEERLARREAKAEIIANLVALDVCAAFEIKPENIQDTRGERLNLDRALVEPLQALGWGEDGLDDPYIESTREKFRSVLMNRIETS